MVFYLIFVGIVSLSFGVLILFFPQTLHNLSDKVSRIMNKVVAPIDSEVYRLKVGFGVSLILVSVLAFFVVYFMIKKGL